MKEIGIKLADGSFYPVMEDGSPCSKNLVLTTVKDNQTRVLVDLYRSKTGTMEDAEYIDSLQIENLVEHPNGSVELSLNIGLDEDNKLSASMNDPETGASSSANVTLVSRTMEERLEPTNYEIVGGKQDEEIPGDDNDFELPDENFAENDVVSEQEVDFELPDEITDDEIIVENPAVTDDVGFSDFDAAEESSSQENPDAESEIDPETEQSGKDKNTVGAGTVGAVAAGAAAGGLLAMAMANKAGRKDNAENPAEDMTVDSVASDDFLDFSSPDDNDSFELPEDMNIGEEKAAADSEFESSAEEGQVAADTAEPAPETGNIGESEQNSEKNDFDFELPDFNDDGINVESEDTADTGASDTGMPDMEETVVSEEEPAATTDDGGSTVAAGDDMFSSDDFNLPDFNDTDESLPENSDELADDDFIDTVLERDGDSADKYVKDATPSSGIVFDGLYDKETAEGNSASEEDDTVEKKTRVPVVICVVCAIICIIATLLVLFVVPSKYNLLNKHAKPLQEKIEIQADDGQTEENTMIVPDEGSSPVEAVEDDIVVVTEPEIVETVVPEPPAEPEKKSADVTYKIKWGDTLWDIADAYYKNPWRYHMIAKYNNIRNPDYIISGTTIVLPAK